MIMNRRQFLHTVGGVGVVMTGTGVAVHDPRNKELGASSDTQQCDTTVYTSEFPELDWNTIHVPEYDTVINWYDGYEEDAVWVESLLPHTLPKADEVFPYSQKEPLVIDLYPKNYYPRDGSITSYESGMGEFVVMTPTDAWSKESFAKHDSDAGIWYRHAILDGVFPKRVQEYQQSEVIIPTWFMAGFVEELTVNHTYTDIHDEYVDDKLSLIHI